MSKKIFNLKNKNEYNRKKIITEKKYKKKKLQQKKKYDRKNT